MRDADGVGNRQVGQSRVDHRHRHAVSRPNQRGGPTDLMHESMRASRVAILLRIAIVVRIASVMIVVVAVHVCGYCWCVLGSMEFAELG